MTYSIFAVGSSLVNGRKKRQIHGEYLEISAPSFFSSILTIIDLNSELYKYSSVEHNNDMDMLQLGYPNGETSLK